MVCRSLTEFQLPIPVMFLTMFKTKCSRNCVPVMVVSMF